VGDLDSSIVDGRYHEQKYRLSRAPGIKQVIYLVEEQFQQTMWDIGQRRFHGDDDSARSTAITHTQLITGLNVILTHNSRRTCEVLAKLHMRVTAAVSRAIRSPLRHTSCVATWEFAEWEAVVKKHVGLTTTQTFGRHLGQVAGCGVKAVEVLVSKWPTPWALYHGLMATPNNKTITRHLKLFAIDMLRLNQKAAKGFRPPVIEKTFDNLRALYAPASLTLPERDIPEPAPKRQRAKAKAKKRKKSEAESSQNNDGEDD